MAVWARALRRGAATILVTLTIAATGCGDGSDAAEPDPDADLPQIVVTTTVLGDVTANVAGEDAGIEVLLPPGADPHGYQASARQVAAIDEADLVIANGLGLEEGLTDVLQAAADDGANVLEVGELLDPIPFGAAGHGRGDLDPHIWLDPVRMAEAARLIATELAALEPGVDWATRAEAYAADLGDAHVEIESILSQVPAESRKLVTSHRAFGYFADRYGFEIVGVVIPGGSTLADPSSAELSSLVETIEHERVRAIFAETTEPIDLAEAVAAEVGRDVEVVELHTGSLGEPGSGADTLIGMLVTNAARIAAALS